MWGPHTQAIGFHKKLFAGTNRITIDASCRNMATPTTLYRFVDPQDHWLLSCHKQMHQDDQQAATKLSRGPFGSIEHPMIVLELLFVRASHRSQDGSNGSLSRSQDRSDQEHLGPFPHPFAQGRFKMAQHVYNPFRQSQHLFFFLRKNFERSLLCLSFFVYRLDKVYLRGFPVLLHRFGKL
jgi:hypothetical protein